VIEAFDPELIRARSEPEARFYCLCVDAGLPRPLVNRRVDVGQECFEVDLLWREQRVILEVDSAFHDTTAAKIRDRARDAALRDEGWTVVRHRPDDLDPGPGPVIAELRGRVAR
jgi:very-short-patch-repair endonuclease